MTETELIISEMSQVTISDDLLKQVNMKELIEEFKSNHDKLDNFQKARDSHEKRGTGKKIWDAISFDKTMENAQLSATEVQAKFSKSLGQLMVISVAQSQHLQQQQEQLAMQQGIIKNQTEQIELQTYEIKEQHDVLAKQSDELNKLLNNFLTFKGLTSERIDQLSSIVQSMESIRDSLLNAVDDKIKESHQWVLNEYQKLNQDISSHMIAIEESIQKNVAEITKRCEVIESDSSHLSQQLLEIKTTFSEKYEAFNTVLINERDRLDTHTTNTEKSFTDLTNNFNDIQEEFRAFREKQQQKIEKLTMIFGVVSIGLVGTVTYLLFTC